MSDTVPCPERDRLSRKVTNAVGLIGKIKAQLERAVSRGEPASEHFDALTRAKAAARIATAALDAHHKEHGC